MLDTPEFHANRIKYKDFLTNKQNLSSINTLLTTLDTRNIVSTLSRTACYDKSRPIAFNIHNF